MLKYMEDLEEILKIYSLKKDDIVIVGSSALTVIGGRLNGDLDFSINRYAYKKIPLRVRVRLIRYDHWDLSEDVDLFRNRYLCCGITDYDLFEKKLYHTIEGYKVAIPELEYAYKKKMNRSKDIDDLRILSQLDNMELDMPLVEVFERGYVNINNGIFLYLKEYMRYIYRRIKKLCVGGGEIASKIDLQYIMNWKGVYCNV